VVQSVLAIVKLFKRITKISYAEAVEALYWILLEVKERRAEKISQITPERFQSLCGGMGALNDITICKENGHNIDPERLPLANVIVTCLFSVTSSACSGSLTPSEAVSACGTDGRSLSGWRCRDCGHSEVTRDGILYYVSEREVRSIIGRESEAGSLAYRLQAFWNSFHGDVAVEEITPLLKSSDITFASRNGWMRPCPKCASDNTCVYRWRHQQQGFVPEPDNLPISQR
jgi:hypothetical protein